MDPYDLSSFTFTILWYDIYYEKFCDLLQVIADRCNYIMLSDIRWAFVDCYKYITKCYYSLKRQSVCYGIFTRCYELNASDVLKWIVFSFCMHSVTSCL